MTKTLAAAALLATLGLAACNQASTPSRIGGQSDAPSAVSEGTGGGVGSSNNSSHSNTPSAGGTGGSN